MDLLQCSSFVLRPRLRGSSFVRDGEERLQNCFDGVVEFILDLPFPVKPPLFRIYLLLRNLFLYTLSGVQGLGFLNCEHTGNSYSDVSLWFNGFELGGLSRSEQAGSSRLRCPFGPPFPLLSIQSRSDSFTWLFRFPRSRAKQGHPSIPCCFDDLLPRRKIPWSSNEKLVRDFGDRQRFRPRPLPRRIRCPPPPQWAFQHTDSIDQKNRICLRKTLKTILVEGADTLKIQNGTHPELKFCWGNGLPIQSNQDKKRVINGSSMGSAFTVTGRAAAGAPRSANGPALVTLRISFDGADVTQKIHSSVHDWWIVRRVAGWAARVQISEGHHNAYITQKKFFQNFRIWILYFSTKTKLMRGPICLLFIPRSSSSPFIACRDHFRKTNSEQK